MKTQDNRAYKLLKIWVDALLKYRIDNIENPRLKGGFVCPACGIVHGRCFDLVLPLCYLYKYEKDEKYLTAAREVMDFSETLKLRDGTCYNDFGAHWYGISAFYADALIEALETSGDALPKDFYDRVEQELLMMGENIRVRFLNEKFNPNVNYLAGGMSLMAKMFAKTGDEKYLDAGKYFKKRVLEYIADDNMLFGEKNGGGKTPSKKGYLPVDLGYNFDESFALIIAAAKIFGDDELFEIGLRLSREALMFMLPDGAIDDSWGSRSAKWTYYGSRTSDGAGCLFALLNDYPEMCEAATRHLEILEKCTDNEGLLSGGAWYKEAGEPSCIHHAFSHAKSLVALSESGIDFERKTALPLDNFEGTKSYSSVGVHIASKGDVYASFIASDLDYTDSKKHNPLGGALTLLYSRMLNSPVIAATQNTSDRVEPTNMQALKNGVPMKCMTVRIENGGMRSNISSEFDTSFNSEDYTFSTKGKLSSMSGLLDGKYEMSFEVLSDGCIISAKSEKGGKFIIPLVLRPDETAEMSENKQLSLFRNGGTVTLESTDEISVNLNSREFNTCGGFTYIVPEIVLKENETVRVKIKVTK